MSDENERGARWGDGGQDGNPGAAGGRNPGNGRGSHRGEPDGGSIYTAREAWELDQRIQAIVRRTWASWLQVKPDDDAAFQQFAEMLKERRTRTAFYADLKARSISGVLVALCSAAAVWIATTYLGAKP